MPRKNNTLPHIRFHMSSPVPGKRRFASKQLAEKEIKRLAVEHPDLTLSTYKDIDGGWYLTTSQQASYTT